MIASVRFRVHIRATEDEEKVRRALKEFIGLDPFTRKEERKGVHGNRIIVLTGEIKGKLAREIGSLLIREFYRDAKEVDERGVVHIRVDKDSLVEGRPRRGKNNVVKVEIKVVTHPFSRERVVREVEEIRRGSGGNA